MIDEATKSKRRSACGAKNHRAPAQPPKDLYVAPGLVASVTTPVRTMVSPETTR